eukprot:8968019-Alexandrium_andersonii.AAC.1
MPRGSNQDNNAQTPSKLGSVPRLHKKSAPLWLSSRRWGSACARSHWRVCGGVEEHVQVALVHVRASAAPSALLRAPIRRAPFKSWPDTNLPGSWKEP